MRVRHLSLALLAGLALSLGSTLPVAAASPGIILGTASGPIALPSDGNFHELLAMVVPAGNWWLTATATVDASSAGADGTSITTCRLTADNTPVGDETSWALDGHPNANARESLFVTSVYGDGTQFAAGLACALSNASIAVSISNVAISAVNTSFTQSPLIKSTGSGLKTIAGGSSFHTLGTLSLPKGKWWIVAKTSLTQGSSLSQVDVTCRISLSTTDTDKTRESLNGAGKPGARGEVGLQVTHVFSSAGSARLQCKSALDVSSNNTELIALKAGKLTRRELGHSASSIGTSTPYVSTGYRTTSTNVNVGFFATVASLPLAAGKWWVTAKVDLTDTSAAGVECALNFGENSDDHVSFGAPKGGFTGLYFQTAGQTGTAQPAVFECRSGGSGPKLSNLRITAVKAGTLSVVPLE